MTLTKNLKEAGLSNMIPSTIADLIMQYVDDGYDVTIAIRHNGDGSPGKLSVPTSWAVRLGMDLPYVPKTSSKR